MGVEAKNVRANTILHKFLCAKQASCVCWLHSRCVWVWSCMWRNQPIWYGHHESNLVSNLFINIRDANKLKGKGHSVNNTAACVVQNPRWNDEAWNENKSTKHGNNERKTYWNCTSITLFFFTSRSYSHSLPSPLGFVLFFLFVFGIATRCRLPAKLINFKLTSCFVPTMTLIHLFWRSYFSSTSIFLVATIYFIINDWLYQPLFFYFRQAFSVYSVLCVLCVWVRVVKLFKIML